MMVAVVAGLGVVLVAVAIVAGLVAFGTARPGPPRASVGAANPLRRVDYGDLPAVSRFVVRDGTPIAYRVYPARAGKVVLLLHGSTSRSRSLHALGRHLAGEGIATAYAIDVRGHGDSGPKGHVAYVGQLEDDVADIVAELRRRHPGAALVVAGFSAGGGLAMRVATGRYADQADAYVFLAPFLGPLSPTNRPNYGGWATPYVPRFIGLTILNRAGITAFNHLPVVAYNLSEEAARELTPTYSWNLANNFRAPDDYRAAVLRLRRPAVLIVGGRDDDFRPEAYADDIGADAQTLPIVIVDDVDHLGLIVDPAALAAIESWLRRLP
jgi:pimeloyl-ACP methyl ester carboxylesterase